MSFTTLIASKTLFLVGIKGSGMSSLALLLSSLGAKVSGSDTTEQFYTDSLLKEAHIEWVEDFSASALPPSFDILIYSASYSEKNNEQIRWAKEHNKLLYSYPQWLGCLSSRLSSYGVAGTHGKTTCVGSLEWMLHPTTLSALFLYGSQLQQRLPQKKGEEITHAFFEACEYRNHFHSYKLEGLLITTIEMDHPDFFKDEQELLLSFIELVRHLPLGSPIVVGYDSPLSRELVQWITTERTDLHLITYGYHPLSGVTLKRPSKHHYSLSLVEGEFSYLLGSNSLAANLVGSALLATMITLREKKKSVTLKSVAKESSLKTFLERGATFSGCKGRLEVVADHGGITYIDDYAHHPTEMRTALQALDERYPDKEAVVIFYPHTLSRTQALYKEFVEVCKTVEKLIIRPIYPSQREDGSPKERRELALLLAQQSNSHFCEDDETTATTASELLSEGSLCITMGAGNKGSIVTQIIGKRESRTW